MLQILSTQPHRLSGLVALTLPGWEGKEFYRQPQAKFWAWCQGLRALKGLRKCLRPGKQFIWLQNKKGNCEVETDKCLIQCLQSITSSSGLSLCSPKPAFGDLHII